MQFIPEVTPAVGSLAIQKMAPDLLMRQAGYLIRKLDSSRPGASQRVATRRREDSRIPASLLGIFGQQLEVAVVGINSVAGLTRRFTQDFGPAQGFNGLCRRGLRCLK